MSISITRSLGFSLVLAAAGPGCRDHDREDAAAAGTRVVEASARHSLTPAGGPGASSSAGTAPAGTPMGTGPGDQDPSGVRSDAGVGPGDGGMTGGDGGVPGGNSDGGMPAPAPDRTPGRGGSGWHRHDRSFSAALSRRVLEPAICLRTGGVAQRLLLVIAAAAIGPIGLPSHSHSAP
jgi:hypothetical protein